jgi:hypothetical protein
MGELEKLIDNLIRDVKNPKMRKDLISRLKAAQSKEQPLEDLTDGKLEEIEKLKKKLNKVAKLNKSLVKISKERRWNRSTGSPLSGGAKNEEDSRLLSTGAGTGWKGFTEKPKVRAALPKGTEKKPAETFAVSNKQPYGGKSPLSRTVSTGVKTDEPTTGGVKDSAAPITNTSSKQNKKENKKESKSRKFLNRLLGRGEKEKPLTNSKAPTPTSTETSRTQSGAIPKPDDKTSQTATASTSQIKEEPKKKKKEKKQESNADALERLKREHEASKKKREALSSGKKVEKPKGKKGKKGKKTVSTSDFTSEFSRGAPRQDEVDRKREQQIERGREQMVSTGNFSESYASGVNRRNTRRKKKSLIKAMEEFLYKLEKDASGYGDLGVANVYPMESYNEPSLIGKPVGEIQSPSNISETYIVSRESKGKENDNEQDNKN